MATESWLEPRTRIPFAGIIAIVLIVAVVAGFAKSNMGPFYTDEEFTVTTVDSASPAVAGSASFRGAREIPLEYKERLQGIVTVDGTTSRFTVDWSARLLTIDSNGDREEVLLDYDERGLSAEFERDGREVRVDVLGAERQLLYSRPDTSTPVLAVALGDLVTLEGFFIYNNEKFLFQYFPASEEVAISAGSVYDTVRLSSDLTGIWNYKARQHPVRVDQEEAVGSVEELW